MYLPFFLCFVFYFVYSVLWWVLFLFCVLCWENSCKSPTSTEPKKQQHQHNIINVFWANRQRISASWGTYSRDGRSRFFKSFTVSVPCCRWMKMSVLAKAPFQSSPFNFIHLQSSPGTFNHLQSKLVPPFLRSAEIKGQTMAISSHTCFQCCSWLRKPDDFFERPRSC